MNSEVQPPQKLSTNRWVWFIALTLILGGSWMLINQVPQGGSAALLEPAPAKGHPAPEIALISTDGQPMALSDFRGQPVVINFWATWCAPCRAETPELQDIHRERGDEVIIFSVNSTVQDQGDIEAFIEEFGVTFPVLLDPDGLASEEYNLLGLPTTIFVNKDGIIEEVFTGPVNKAYIESKIPELS